MVRNMRVISGSARGRVLSSPDGNDVRPTTDKVKESMFNIIQFEIPGADVLDLFAGTGQLGIEALSRGAASCVFVDRSRRSLEVVRKNIAATGLSNSSVTVFSSAEDFLSSDKRKYDIVFLDPPYHNGLCDKVFPLLASRLNVGAAVICETQADEVLPEVFGEFAVDREYRYSAIKLTLYRKAEAEERE